MKTTLLLIALIFSSFCFCQTINDVPLSEIESEFVEIVGTQKLLSNKVTVRLDFGQENPLFSGSKTLAIKDENGKNVIFNSMVDALNFMAFYGYKFEQAYTVTIGNQNVYHFLLSKE